MIKLTSLRLTAIVSLLTFSLVNTGCLKTIPYEPSQLATFDAEIENVRLEFVTEKGRQVAFYLPPLISPEKPPKRINILYPGIYAVALGWRQFISQEEDPEAAYLLIDYPGRGLCEGSMRPEKNYLNTEGALDALEKRYGKGVFDAELSLMGHSFGTGAALNFAERAEVKRIVLVSPFNTLTKAVALQSWLLSILMPSQINNNKIIRKLLDSDHPPQIMILHGSLDTTLPVTMGRELAAIDPEKIDFYEFTDDDHVSLLTTRRDLIFNLLNGRGDRSEPPAQTSAMKSQK